MLWCTMPPQKDLKSFLVAFLSIQIKQKFFLFITRLYYEVERNPLERNRK